jgi:pimeloyl-ACP methyl ester carboxylesterase
VKNYFEDDYGFGRVGFGALVRSATSTSSPGYAPFLDRSSVIASAAVDETSLAARNEDSVLPWRERTDVDWTAIASSVESARAQNEIARLPGIDHSGFAMFKRVLRAVAKQSPAFAARLATRVLTTPPKARPKRAHTALVATATPFPLWVGGTRACGYAWGSGPAVILSHGWCADVSWFAPYIAQLNALGFQAVAFDAPGHGLAARNRTDMFGFAACIGGASDWVIARGGKVQAVVGHSFGAVAAAIAMRDWNIPCERLALISAFTDCNWVVDAFVRMAELPPEIGKLMCEQHAGIGSGSISQSRTSVVDMIRRAPERVFLAHDRDDSEVPFWHALALYEGCRRAEFYQTRKQGHRRIVRDAGVVDALVNFVSR